MSSSRYVQAADSPDGIDSITMLFVMLIGVVVVVSLIGYLCSSVAQRGRLPRSRSEWLGVTAVLCACATIALYLWGALHVIFMEDKGMREACREAGGEQKAAQVDGYEASYLPLRFVCRVDGGGSYPAAVPAYVNPAMGAFFVLTVAAAGASRVTRADDRPRQAQL